MVVLVARNYWVSHSLHAWNVAVDLMEMELELELQLELEMQHLSLQVLKMKKSSPPHPCRYFA